jgi:hypothetical protein
MLNAYVRSSKFDNVVVELTVFAFSRLILNSENIKLIEV